VNRITIVNYGLGNLRSIGKAIEYIGEKALITNSQKDILKAERLILPGIGSYKKAMDNIHKSHLFEPLNEAVLINKVPILGICLGMHIFSDYGEEHGGSTGFGWIPGKVIKFNLNNKLHLRLPHIGFNTVHFKEKNKLLSKGISQSLDYYFVHSYHFIPKDDNHVYAVTNYGYNFVSAVRNQNIYGTQFHPEKSQGNGLILLKNFCKEI